jgi:hypothetical protein
MNAIEIIRTTTDTELLTASLHNARVALKLTPEHSKDVIYTRSRVVSMILTRYIEVLQDQLATTPLSEHEEAARLDEELEAAQAELGKLCNGQRSFIGWLRERRNR